MAPRKPWKDALRAMQGGPVEQIDFVATYKPDLIAKCVSEAGGNVYIKRRALRDAVMQTYAHLCKQSPGAMRVRRDHAGAGSTR